MDLVFLCEQMDYLFQEYENQTIMNEFLCNISDDEIIETKDDIVVKQISTPKRRRTNKKRIVTLESDKSNVKEVVKPRWPCEVCTETDETTWHDDDDVIAPFCFCCEKMLYRKI